MILKIGRKDPRKMLDDPMAKMWPHSMCQQIPFFSALKSKNLLVPVWPLAVHQSVADRLEKAHRMGMTMRTILPMMMGFLPVDLLDLLAAIPVYLGLEPPILHQVRCHTILTGIVINDVINAILSDPMPCYSGKC
jgi:hypothetical protein